MKKKSSIWLWIFAWLFLFPITLTVVLLRSKLKPVIKYGLVAVMWGFFLLSGLSGGSGDTSNNQRTVSNASTPAPETLRTEDDVKPVLTSNTTRTELKESNNNNSSTVVSAGDEKRTPAETPEPEETTIPASTIEPQPQSAVDDCGWVNDPSYPDGGYCSYHPEWYAAVAAEQTTRTYSEPSYQDDYSQGNSNFQTWDEPYSGSAVYVGNANTMKFHYPGCSSVSKMSPSNRVDLYSREEAMNYGYVPCKICNP